MAVAGGRRSVRIQRPVATAVLVLAVVALVAVLLVVLPAPRAQVNAEVMSRAEAEAAYARRAAGEAADRTLFPECVSIDLPAVGPPQGVILLFHGYTSCPQQMRPLAEQLTNRGYRVLVPRLPYHGVADTFVEPEPVRVQPFADFGDDMVDIAAALHENVVVGGLSGGGTLALWLGTHRPEVDRAVPLAPMLSPRVVPTVLSRPAGNLLRLAPNFDQWWDPNLAGQPSVPRYSYGQYKTRSIAALMSLGRDARNAPDRASAQNIYIVNGADGSVDNAVTEQTAEARRQQGDEVVVYEIPGSLGAPHEFLDFVNPDNRRRAPETYPPLIDLLTTGTTQRWPRRG